MSISARQLAMQCWRAMRSLIMLPMVFALLTTTKLNTRLTADNKSTVSEYAVKAAYIYNILRFVSWDKSRQLSHAETLSVCQLIREDQ